MSSGGYEDWLPSKCPWPGPNWRKFWKAVGQVMDEQTTRMRLAGKASQPDGAQTLGLGTYYLQPALNHIGDDRGLPRGGTACDVYDQTDVSYGATLKNAWTLWGQDDDDGGGAGTVLGLMRELKRNGFPDGANGTVLVNHIGIAYTLISDALVMADCMPCINRTQKDGTIPVTPLKGFTLDARDQFYSHFVLLFLQDIPLYNIDDNGGAKPRLNGIVQRWKPGNAIYDGAIVIKTGPVWGWPVGTKWGDTGLKWGAAGTDNRHIPPE
jgi:hypothetical protein